ncbi:MAG: Holliday junction branch migration protein RuvA, partial [Pyrinomonadaceae bacterium]|nr:Holliday junction branch migration protein RuvA [Pyrinomonadaceae bacterium]
LEEEFATAAGSGAPASEDAMRDDALSALVNLGYQKAPAEKAVTAAMQEGGDLSVEVLLRRSLRLLAKG